MDSEIVAALITSVTTLVAAIIMWRARPRPERDEPVRRRGSPAGSSAKARSEASHPGDQDSSGATSAEEEEAEDLTEEEEIPQLSVADDTPVGPSVKSEHVLMPCPACGKKLRIFPQSWFKRGRCKACGALIRPSPVPGSSAVLRPGTGGRS